VSVIGRYFGVAAILIPATGAAGECAPPSGAPPFCLSGTITAGADRVALVEEAGSPGFLKLREGATLNGWAVTEIGRRYLIVGHDDSSVRLEVGVTAPSGAAAPSAPGKPRPPASDDD
jgi:hypothetical protein